MKTVIIEVEGGVLQAVYASEQIRLVVADLDWDSGQTVVISVHEEDPTLPVPEYILEQMERDRIDTHEF